MHESRSDAQCVRCQSHAHGDDHCACACAFVSAYAEVMIAMMVGSLSIQAMIQKKLFQRYRRSNDHAYAQETPIETP